MYLVSGKYFFLVMSPVLNVNMTTRITKSMSKFQFVFQWYFFKAPPHSDSPSWEWSGSCLEHHQATGSSADQLSNKRPFGIELMNKGAAAALKINTAVG